MRYERIRVLVNSLIWNLNTKNELVMCREAVGRMEISSLQVQGSVCMKITIDNRWREHHCSTIYEDDI